MIGYVIWALLFAGMIVVEALGLTLPGHQWPTVSDIFRTATRPTAGRWILFALWLWTGWHFFVRGWQFFLRGSGAAEPGRGVGGGKTLGAVITEVVVPLLALYLTLLAGIVLGYRAAARGRQLPPVREIAAAPIRRPLAFLRFVLVTTIAGYAIFAATIALYALVVHSGTAGIVGSALWYGAFLAFAVALPAFVALSFAEVRVRSRSRGHHSANADRPLTAH